MNYTHYVLALSIVCLLKAGFNFYPRERYHEGEPIVFGIVWLILGLWGPYLLVWR